MFCFVCRAFAHKVIGSVGQVDPAFTTSLEKVLSKHQASSVHKQAALCRKDFETIAPINLQLDKAVEASRFKEQQEKSRQILYRIIKCC